VNFQSVRTRQPLVSVTKDGDFAYVHVGCGHVTCKREGNHIVVVAGPGCQLAVSGNIDTVPVGVSSKEVAKAVATVVAARA
jgi:hypothetical protein